MTTFSQTKPANTTHEQQTISPISQAADNLQRKGREGPARAVAAGILYGLLAITTGATLAHSQILDAPSATAATIIRGVVK